MRPHKSSAFHLAVSAHLTELGVAHENECVAGGLAVDILIRGRDASVFGGRELIIEVDGPSHFLRGGDGANVRSGRTTRVNGFYAFKERLLEKQGFKVLHIPYFDWELLAGDAERAEYLRRLMAVDK